MSDINRRIRRLLLILLPVLIILLAAYIVALSQRWRLFSAAAVVLTALTTVFGTGFYLVPFVRYRRFLTDMNVGLSREMTGRIVEISQEVQAQDGIYVHQLRLWLEDIRDEHIVYLNASKIKGFPEAGARVRLGLFGRHIKSVELLTEGEIA